MEVKRGQNIIDAVIIATGRSEAAVEVAIANEVSLTDDVGEIEIGDVDENKSNKTMLTMTKSEPATGVSEADEAAAPYRGIGFWAIEEDFVIDN